ncbi:MAG: branched-chain amino acid ABC transporter permease [Thermoplasmatota archaeon]
MSLVEHLFGFVTNESLLLELLWRFLLFLILASALDLAIGYTGLFQLGHVGFFALGAFGSTVGTHPDLLGLDLFGGLLLGVIFTTAAIFFVGVPTLRLSGDYFAIATLGLGVMTQVILVGFYANGKFGVPTLNPLGCDLACMGDATGMEPRLLEVLLVGAAAFVIHTALGRMKRSPMGRVLKAVREDKHAAAAMGKDVEWLRLKALWISAVVAGIAGGLWVHHLQILSPSGYSFHFMVTIVVMVILGGLGSHHGALVGALLVTLIDEVALGFTQWLGEVLGGADATDLDLPSLRIMLFSLVLLLLMLTRPNGILGGRDVRLRDLLRPRARGAKGAEEDQP